MATAPESGKLSHTSAAVSDKQVLKQAARTGDTVFVACKFPTGIKLEIFQKVVEQEMTPAGRRPMEVHRRTGVSFFARGPRLQFGVMPTFMIISGFAVTPACPADLWEKYVEQNSDADILKNFVLMAAPTLDEITAKCREHAKVLSGFEPLNMTPDAKGRVTDPRVPRSNMPGVSQVTTAEGNQPDIMPQDFGV